MGLRLGNTEISDFKMGSTQVDKIYKGTTLLWENYTPPAGSDPGISADINGTSGTSWSRSILSGTEYVSSDLGNATSGPPWFEVTGSVLWNSGGLSGGSGAQLGWVIRTGDTDQEDSLAADIYSTFVNEENYKITFGRLDISGSNTAINMTAIGASNGFSSSGDPTLFIKFSSADTTSLQGSFDILRNNFPSNNQKVYWTFGHQASEETGGDVDVPAGETDVFTVASSLPPAYGYATSNADGSGTDHYSRSELDITNFFLTSNGTSQIFFPSSTERDAFTNGSVSLRFSNSVATWEIDPSDCSVGGSNSLTFSTPVFVQSAGDQVPMTITLFT